MNDIKEQIKSSINELEKEVDEIEKTTNAMIKVVDAILKKEFEIKTLKVPEVPAEPDGYAITSDNVINTVEE